MNANLIVEATLLEVPSEAPRCGDVKVAVAYRFRVRRVMKGKPTRGSLVVLVPCPDLKGDGFFTVGGPYRIEATADLGEARSYTIYNDYARNTLWWCVSITLIGSGREKR